MSYLANTYGTVFQPAPVGDLVADIEAILAGGAVNASQADPDDNVDQTAGGGSVTSADFTSVNGVCKARNFPALAAAKELQAQLNRVAQMKKFGKIGVDGAIGPGTLALFRAVQTAAAGAVMGDPSSCAGVAADADVLSEQVKAFANSLNAPAQVSAAVSLSYPSIVTKSGKTVVPPDAGITGDLASMSTLERLAIVGVAGAIGYLVYTGAKRRKGRR